MSVRKTKVLVVGSGPAGYTAAIYAARANLKPILVQGMSPGGQLTITTDVENYPGFADVIQGPWLMEQMLAQAKNVDTEVVNDHIKEVDFGKNREFVCYGTSGDEYVAESVIIATGAEAQWLGLEGEKKYQGFGVSACATCDGFFFRGEKVMVIGGGNTAVEEAIYLTNHASEVVLVHRRDKLRAEMILQQRLLNNKKISVIWNAELIDVLGKEGEQKEVTGARIRYNASSTDKANQEEDIELSGIFIAIGHKPNTSVFSKHLSVDGHGYITTEPGTTKTSVPGIYAAGDVQDKIYRQAVTAAGTGCMAALDAQKFIEDGA